MALIKRITPVSDLLKGRYFMDGNFAHEIEELYGPKLMCRLVGQDGHVSDIIKVFEIKDGMEFHTELPEGYLTATDDAPETAGPNAREFAHAVYKMTDEQDDDEGVTLHHIANFLDYEYDPVQRRAARIMRELRGIIAVERRGRNNYYTVVDTARVVTFLRGNAS